MSVSAIETETMARVSRRLIPFLILCYFIAYLDRVNVGFAALEMNRALGFSPTVYAWGAGIFFIAYFLFEVPSNIILERVGARVWIARIMLTWGILSGCMAFIQGPWSLYTVRFLLGIAEAGFFPGITLRAVQRCAASLVSPGRDRSGQNGSGGREVGFPDRRNSDS